MRLTKQMTEHIKGHQNYPATKAQMVKECNNLADFTADEKRWFEKNLPPGTYNSASKVIDALS